MTYQNHAQFLMGEELDYLASELDAILPDPNQLGRESTSKKESAPPAQVVEADQKITITTTSLLRRTKRRSSLVGSFFRKHLCGVSKEDELYRNHAVKSVVREYKLFPVLWCKLQNKWDWFQYKAYIDRSERPIPMPVMFPRERFLAWMLVFSAVLLFMFPSAPAESMEMTAGMPIDLATLESLEGKPDPIWPTNWVNGQANLKGSKAAVMGAFDYATQAGYTFAANETERDRLVANGTLVRLEGKYIRLIDVTEPYVLPVVASFVNRLGEQYAARGCGKLEVTGAMRNLDHQDTLKNGSSHSVHPTGMPVDLRRIVPSNEAGTFCLFWLEDTLKKIEAQRRIDVTAENMPRHFHVVAVPHVYEAWLTQLPKNLDPEVKWLATALYFEAAFNESMAGYRAIGWVIRNRVHSADFPNTIVEVVAEGAAGRSAGGCQFSFMCDGKAERIQTLCAQPNTLMSQYWRGKCDERFEVVVNIAKQLLAEPKSSDPTGGAVLYYAASMNKAPYWAKSDMKRGTVRKIGSHVFACSDHRGSDVCIEAEGGL